MSAYLIFAGSHATLHAERVLREHGITVRVGPPPPGLGAPCGLALAVPEGDRDRSLAVLAEAGARPAREA